MPTIEQDVDSIRNAIYGKDVREAIADGIEKCYANVEEIIDGIPSDYAALSNTVNVLDGVVSGVGQALSTNVLFFKDTFVVKTLLGQWTSKSIIFDVTETNSVWLQYDSVSYNGNVTIDNKILIIFLSAGGSEITHGYIHGPGIEVSVPTGTSQIQLQFFTNNGTAVNTMVTFTNLLFVKNAKRLVNDISLETTVGDASLGEITGKINLLDELQTNNVIVKYSELVATAYKGTWVSYDRKYRVPEGAVAFGVTWDSVTYDGGVTPSVLIGVNFLDSSENPISSTYYITVNGATPTIPSMCVTLEFRYFVNTTNAANTEARFKNLVIFANTKQYGITIKDDVKLKNYTVAEVNEYLKTIEPIKNTVIASKNLFAEDAFQRGVINASSGVYGATPQNINNTATPEMIPVEGNMQYTWSWDWNRYYLTGYLFEYNINGLFLGRRTIDDYMRRDRYVTFTTLNDTRFVRFMIYSDNVPDYDQMITKHPQLEIGGIPSQYQSVSDISNSVDFDSIKNRQFAIPMYYFRNGYLNSKADDIRQLIFETNGNYDAFIFITDTHWEDNQQNSIGLIHYLARALNVNKLFHGGDIYSTWKADPHKDSSKGVAHFHDELLKDLDDAFGIFPYCVAGNHEYLGSMTDTQIWYYLNSRHRDIVPGNTSRSYYYVNDTVTKTRYIVLNVAEDDGDEAAFNFENDQALWFRDTALTVDPGWRIVVFAHCLYNVGGLQRTLFPIDNVTTTIESIVDSYSGNGKIVCIIQGHIHVDRITYTQGGIPIIATTCDKNAPWTDPNTGQTDLSYVNRDSGTINEQAFDVFVIDYTHKKISAVRIGSPAFNGVGNNMGVQTETRVVTYS